MKWGFCIKVSNKHNNINTPWPKGKYCIFRVGGFCPAHFQKGYIRWDDENSHNRNHAGGILPDGQYKRDTIIDFCCRNDGSTATPIILPTNRPFILMPTQRGRLCQAVFGMKVTYQWFKWDDEDSHNKSFRGGSHPYDASGKHDHWLSFCLYHR